MRLHYLQHVPFENLGSLAHWAQQQQLPLSHTPLFSHCNFPAQHSFDALVVMGGPMGVKDSDNYPWLTEEKQFIAQTIEAEKPVLGICLGAQLIADVMGAPVERNPHSEIGWFPVSVNDQLNNNCLGSTINSSSIDAFHWHGDRFSIPSGAIPFGSSEACDNQGFIYQNRVLGLQCHLEVTHQGAQELIHHCKEDLVKGKYIQTAETILASEERFTRANQLMAAIAHNFFLKEK